MALANKCTLARVAYKAGGTAFFVSCTLARHPPKLVGHRHSKTPRYFTRQNRNQTPPMESNTAGNVHYDRWNEDNINMNVEASQSAVRRVFNRVCVGRTGLAMKAVGALASLVSVYILGYVTGYYVHQCEM